MILKSFALEVIFNNMSKVLNNMSKCFLTSCPSFSDKLTNILVSLLCVRVVLCLSLSLNVHFDDPLDFLDANPAFTEHAQYHSRNTVSKTQILSQKFLVCVAVLTMSIGHEITVRFGFSVTNKQLSALQMMLLLAILGQKYFFFWNNNLLASDSCKKTKLSVFSTKLKLPAFNFSQIWTQTQYGFILQKVSFTSWRRKRHRSSTVKWEQRWKLAAPISSLLRGVCEQKAQ